MRICIILYRYIENIIYKYIYIYILYINQVTQITHLLNADLTELAH